MDPIDASFERVCRASYLPLDEASPSPERGRELPAAGNPRDTPLKMAQGLAPAAERGGPCQSEGSRGLWPVREVHGAGDRRSECD